MKIFLSSLERRFADPSSYFSGKQGLFPYVLLAFGHVSAPDELAKVLPDECGCEAMLDAGFVTINRGRAEATKQEYGALLDNYIKFVKTNSAKINCAVEFDVNETFGYEVTKEFRQRFREENISPMYVFHWQTGEAGLYDILELEDDPLIGVSIDGLTGEKKINNLYEFVFARTECKKRIHGIGMTNSNCLKRYPFCSVSSSNWFQSLNYGRISYFDGVSMSLKTGIYSVDRDKILGQSEFFESMVKLDDIFEDSPHGSLVRNFFSALQYVKMGKALTELWKKRGVIWKN